LTDKEMIPADVGRVWRGAGGGGFVDYRWD